MAIADTFACPWHGERPPEVGVRGEGLALAGEELSASSDEQDRVHLLRRAHGAWGGAVEGSLSPISGGREGGGPPPLLEE